MKKLGMQSLIFNVLFVIVTALSLASCQQHILVATSSRESVANFENSGGLAVTVANFVDQSQRTIAPSQLTGTNLLPANYRLRLTGTSGSGVVGFPDQDLNLTNGKVVIHNVPESLWELTLTATAVATGNGVTAGATILEGKTVAQVSSSGMTPVMFTLKPLETGNGSIYLTINIDQGNRNSQLGLPNIEQTRFRLYEKGTDTLVASIPDTDIYSGRLSSTTYKFPHGGVQSLPAGEYELRVEFRLFGEISAVWKEDIIIEPGRLTNGTITVPHILKNPTQPSWSQPAFNVSLADSGLFEATLNWNTANTTNSPSVTSYEIQLKKLPANDTRTVNVRTEAEFENISGAPIIINGDPNSPHHFSNYVGTYPVALAEGITKLDRTTSSLKLLLADGRYVYRLKSIGHSGQQLWTYGSSNILMPFPAAPTIPANYYTPGSSVGGNNYNVVIRWNASANATQYEIQTLRFDNAARPATATLSRYHNDRAFTGSNAGGIDTVNTNRKDWVFDNRNAYLVRVRAKNPVGTSPWVYFPRLMNRNGIVQ